MRMPPLGVMRISRGRSFVESRTLEPILIWAIGFAPAQLEEVHPVGVKVTMVAPAGLTVAVADWDPSWPDRVCMVPTVLQATPEVGGLI